MEIDAKSSRLFEFCEFKHLWVDWAQRRENELKELAAAHINAQQRALDAYYGQPKGNVPF
jgi:hypothetical protein